MTGILNCCRKAKVMKVEPPETCFTCGEKTFRYTVWFDLEPGGVDIVRCYDCSDSHENWLDQQWKEMSR